MTSAENSNSEPPNLKSSWRRIPPDPPKRLYPSVLAINMPPVCLTCPNVTFALQHGHFVPRE